MFIPLLKIALLFLSGIVLAEAIRRLAGNRVWRWAPDVGAAVGASTLFLVSALSHGLDLFALTGIAWGVTVGAPAGAVVSLLRSLRRRRTAEAT